MDVKKLLTIAIGVVIVAAIVLVIAAVAFNLINGNLSGEPAPVPSATPDASSVTATPSPGATSGASPTANPGSTVTGRIYLDATLNRTSGMCLITVLLNKDVTPVDASRITTNVECNGQTYNSVWTPKSSDWTGANGDTMLEFNEVLSTQLDTVALGIPQDKPITIKILLDGTELQQKTVSPT